MKLKLNNSDVYEFINVSLSKEKTPIAYANRVKSLRDSGFPEDRIDDIAGRPLELELYYDPDTGLFAVEAETVDAGTIYNPYTAELLEDPEAV